MSIERDSGASRRRDIRRSIQRIRQRIGRRHEEPGDGSPPCSNGRYGQLRRFTVLLRKEELRGRARIRPIHRTGSALAASAVAGLSERACVLRHGRAAAALRHPRGGVRVRKEQSDAESQQPSRGEAHPMGWYTATDTTKKGRALSPPLDLRCRVIRRYGVVTITSSMYTSLPNTLMPRKPNWTVVPL